MNLSPLQQNVTAIGQAHVSNISQSVELRLPQRFYVCLYIVNTAGELVSSFEPGQEYFVDISVAQQKQETVWCKEIGGDNWTRFKLELAGFPEAPSVISLQENTVIVNEEQQRQFELEHRFKLETNRILPVAELHIIIKGFKSTKHSEGPREIEFSILEIPVCLNGTYYPPEKELFDLCHVQFGTKLPKDLAILRVNRLSENTIELCGWGLPRRLKTPPVELPPLRLADFVDGQTEPEQVVAIMKQFSRHSPLDFTVWIKKLYEKHKGFLKLLIIDDANSEIPWEMFRLSEKGVFLGEVWSIVRWFDIRDEHTNEYQWLLLDNQKYIGDVIAYYDQHGEQTTKEEDLLNQFSLFLHSTVQQMYERLNKPMNNIAMVYLGTHGVFTYDNDEYKVAIGNWHNPMEQILALSLEQLPACRSLRPIFFVNACHSGRLIRGKWGLYGLPEVLLSRIASGYIGTLGPISVNYAVEVAEFVLKKVRQDSGYINPAEALRRLRAYAAEQEREASPSQKAQCQRQLVYTFMYVYYGNPFSELHLLPNQQWEKNHE